MFLFVCFFVALRPKSTAMVMAGRSVHLTIHFSWAGLTKRLTSTSCTLQLVTSLTANPGVASLIPAHSYTFAVIDHEAISIACN